MHQKSLTPYKDVTLDEGLGRQFTLDDMLVDDLDCEFMGAQGGQQAVRNKMLAEGRMICSTIRPGVQFIECDINLLEYSGFRSVWPKCMFLTSLRAGRTHIEVDGLHRDHPTGGVPQLVGLGQETEVRSNEVPGQHMSMSGLMITPEFFDSLDSELAEGMAPLQRFMAPGVTHEVLDQVPLLRELMLRFHDVPFHGALGALYRESLGTAALIELAGSLGRFPDTPRLSDAAQTDIAQAANALIEQNPTAIRSGAELARHLGTNETTLRRSFKEAFGVSLCHHVRARKLERARQMIQRGGRQISEIAFDCGYSNPANFTHAYRRQFGCSPSSDQR